MKKYDFTLYGEINVDFDYTLEEIETRILNFLNECNQPIHVIGICNKITEIALDEERIKGQAKDCFYANPNLSESSSEKIYKILHKLVKEERILYCFGDRFKIWR